MLVLVYVVVLVHVGVPMFFYTCGVFMNTESGVERGAGSEQGARASESEIGSEIAREQERHWSLRRTYCCWTKLRI